MADDPGGLRPTQTQTDNPDPAQLARSGAQTVFVTPGVETPRGNDTTQTAADAVLTGAAQQLQIISGGSGRSGRSTQTRAAPAAAPDAQDQEMLGDDELPEIPAEFLGEDDQIAELAARATEAQITAHTAHTWPRW